ncbi:MAG: hypothetical protein IPJ65_41435 [Archangiaceae bacterium]|nr:hypothetical protein [Archangiaceae bacterium]
MLLERLEVKSSDCSTVALNSAPPKMLKSASYPTEKPALKPSEVVSSTPVAWVSPNVALVAASFWPMPRW